jgi:putative glycosyltransferase (TIGR04348 family)
MKILLVTPAAPGSRVGNNVTAIRWARLLRELGHRVAVARSFENQRPDLMVALHARKSAASICRFAETRPGRPIVLCLSGTDAYQDLPQDPEARRSVELADRIVILQPLAAERVEPEHRAKCRTIYQSAVPPASGPLRPPGDGFPVCVLGHLRDVKDPFRAAEAARQLPAQSEVRIVHLGGALSPEMEARAHQEEAASSRYRWLGDVPRGRALRLLCGCRALVQSSISEGGSNTISEAAVCGVPVLASRIPGNVGLLGEEYPGYFPAGGTAKLAGLLQRLERDKGFSEELRARLAERVERFRPEAERVSWDNLLSELPSERIPLPSEEGGRAG